MTKLPICEIEDGLVLANPLVGATGNTLLPEGAVLKKSMINRLKTWKIHFVDIVGENVEKTLNSNELEAYLLSLSLSNSEQQICILNAIIKYRAEQGGNYRKSQSTFR